MLQPEIRFDKKNKKKQTKLYHLACGLNIDCVTWYSLMSGKIWKATHTETSEVAVELCTL